MRLIRHRQEQRPAGSEGCAQRGDGHRHVRNVLEDLGEDDDIETARLEGTGRREVGHDRGLGVGGVDVEDLDRRHRRPEASDIARYDALPGLGRACPPGSPPGTGRCTSGRSGPRSRPQLVADRAGPLGGCRTTRAGEGGAGVVAIVPDRWRRGSCGRRRATPQSIDRRPNAEPDEPSGGVGGAQSAHHVERSVAAVHDDRARASGSPAGEANRWSVVQAERYPAAAVAARTTVSTSPWG